MNKVILIGRMTKDPETRYTQSGTAVSTFTLAVDRRFKKDEQPSADFVPCVAWNKLAEVIANNLVKGRKVGVEGRLQVRSYDAQDGSKRYVTEVIVDELDFCDSKKQGSGLPAAPDITEEIPF
jgi:single-strand DNA-binding protein